MKVFKFLNKTITIKFEDLKEKGIEKKRISLLDSDVRNNFTYRALFLLFILSTFTLITKVNIFDYKYQIGDIAKKDVISSVYTTYKDDVQKEQIIKKIKLSAGKIYRRDEQSEIIMIEKLDKYFKLILNMDSKLTDEELDLFIKESGVTISIDELRKLITLKKEAKLELKNKLVTIIKALASRGIKDEEIDYMKKIISSMDESLSLFEKNILTKFIEPNEFFDLKATQENQREKIESLDDIVIKISPGDIIVKKGQELNQSDIDKLKKLGFYGAYYSMQTILGLTIYLLIIAIIFYYTSRKFISNEFLQNKYFYSTLIIILGMVILTKVIPIKMMFIYPFGAIVLILGIISKEKFTLIISTLILLVLFALQGFDYILLILNIADIAVGLYYSKKIKNRSDIINAGIVMGVLRTILIFSLDIIINRSFMESIFTMLQSLGAGVLAGMITVYLLPYFENTFNILTNIKLIELSDFSNPLLKELMLKAPGTFHHSILVSTLAENAAEAVGANSIFTRVAAYYHDIGKIKRPNFYVENQVSGINPHENLNPYLSTLVISAHTNDGVEMAKKYKIPKEIRDVMKEHQGTTLLAYFYNKAKKENPDVNEMDFRYEGPKPTTKESAIIMLADTVEAAIRSINEKERNPINIENMVRQVVSGKIEDAQLSNAELTFKDIEIVIQSFIKILQGIYHVRLKYPDMKKAKESKKD